ncbi:hypothetical protein Tco_0749338 [Tanacetum coccineum]|uniref:Uncharacterized protein n=1 Tax=Tanacetum coccineum TaxID=301880 RepID=A0ABQ4Z171_9ASTR
MNNKKHIQKAHSTNLRVISEIAFKFALRSVIRSLKNHLLKKEILGIFLANLRSSIPKKKQVNALMARDDSNVHDDNVISRNEDTPAYHAIASGKIPPKTKGSKKKVDTDATTTQKPPTVPKEKKEKKSGKGKQKAKELETISF